MDLPESAYQKALASFSKEKQAKLTKQETIRGLFQQLNEADHGHQERSLLRKGLKKVKPYLERLNATIDFISPFASMEPAAGSALGLVKGSASVSRLPPEPTCLDLSTRVKLTSPGMHGCLGCHRDMWTL
jgi:hypothetical protein